MATAPSPNDLTRQQLDELDALLQRMLTLPLNPADEPAVAAAPVITEPLPVPAAVPNWRVDPPTPAAMPTPHLLAPPLPADPPRPRLPEPEPFIPPVTRVSVLPEPLPPPPTVPPPEPALPIIERKAAPVVPRSAPPAPAPVVPDAMLPVAEEEPEPEPVPVVVWPLVALNWTVDTVLGLFGPPGRLLRSGFGKNLLGLAGIALLTLTAAHVATDRGWVTLPFPVPWPR